MGRICGRPAGTGGVGGGELLRMAVNQDYTEFFDIQRAEAALVERTRRDFVESMAGLLNRIGARQGPANRISGLVWSLMTESDRHYHTPVHVLGMLGWAQHMGLELTEAEQLAVWFHDSIFDARAPRDQNEAASALWMRWAVVNAGVSNGFAKHVAEAIRWTGRHLEEEVPPEYRRVMDLDLAGMAAAPATFRRQSEAVQAEMAHLSPEQFQRGTIDFFKHLLARKHLYRSESMAPLEPTARQNLQQEIERLTSLLGNQPT